MCGRFTLHSPMNQLLLQFAIEEADPIAREWQPRYNIAPTQLVPVVRIGPDGRRQLVPMRWGLVPPWAKDLAMGNRMINARSETVASRPSFRGPFRRRRCLVPADGFYEWQRTGRQKQPYFVTRRDGQLLALAGLWESWRPAKGAEPLETCTILTTEANEVMRPLHDRMPVLLSAADIPTWLDPQQDDPQVLEPLLVPWPRSDDLETRPIDPYVNNVRHEGPRCLEALP